MKEDDLDSGEVEDDKEESSSLLGLCIVSQAPLEIWHLRNLC